MHTTIITNEGGSQKGCNYRRDVWGGLAGDFLEMPCVPHSSPVSAVQLPDSRAPTGNRDKVGQKAVPKSGPFSDPKTGTAQGNLTGLGTGFRAPKKPGQPSAVGPFLGSPAPLRVQLTPAPPETWLFLEIVEGVRKALWLRPELETAHSTFKQ